MAERRRPRVVDEAIDTAVASRRTVSASWRLFVRWFNALELSENAILIGFAVAIGSATGLGVIVFYRAIDVAYFALFEWPSRHLTGVDVIAYRPLLTAAAFVLAWLVMQRLGRRHEGMNIPDVQLAVVRRGGELPSTPALARTAASAITIGGGGSAGSEGPVAVLGSALGSLLGRGFRFSPDRVKVLVGAGAAAGISAAFNAPLAGAFFALEEILGSFAVGAFPPVVVSSVVAAVVSRAAFGNHPAFPIPIEYGYALQRELIVFYPLLGIVAGLVSALFVRTYFGTESLVRRLPVRPWLSPVLGGLVVGGLVLASRGLLLGPGHLALSLDVFGRLPWFVLALLALGKMVATSVTLNAGGSGGVFTPSLYVGAATGGAFGALLSQLFPNLSLHPEAYALVGMGAVVAASTAAPITAILIVFEMTNDYAIVLPLMLATVISTVVARRIEPDSLYSGWLRRRGERIEHGAAQDVLAGLRVRDVHDPAPRTISEDATLGELLEHLAHGEQMDFPVLDAEHRLVGTITVADLGRVAKDYRDLSPLLLAADVARPCEQVTPDETLVDAVRRMGVRGDSAVAVVEPVTGRFVGLLTRGHVLAAYQRATASWER